VETPEITENTDRRKRSPDCYIKSASDVPAAGFDSGQPKTAGFDKSIRQSSGPQKGKPVEEPAEDSAAQPLKSHRIGRPVTSAEPGNATLGSGVSCVMSPFEPPGLIQLITSLQKLRLQAKGSGCSIGLAYQAADASHPRREERARRPSRKFHRIVDFSTGHPRRNLLEDGHYQGNAPAEPNRSREPERIPAKACGDSGEQAADHSSGMSGGMCEEHLLRGSLLKALAWYGSPFSERQSTLAQRLQGID
jgi:hypothetical protein